MALVGVVADHTTRRASRGGRKSVPVLHLISCYLKRISFVGSDVIREEITPGIVGETEDILCGASCDLGRIVDGADIVRFGVVVPGYDSILLLADAG